MAVFSLSYDHKTFTLRLRTWAVNSVKLNLQASCCRIAERKAISSLDAAVLIFVMVGAPTITMVFGPAPQKSPVLSRATKPLSMISVVGSAIASIAFFTSMTSTL